MMKNLTCPHVKCANNKNKTCQLTKRLFRECTETTANGLKKSRPGPRVTLGDIRGFISEISPYLSPDKLVWYLFVGAIAWAVVSSLIGGGLF